MLEQMLAQQPVHGRALFVDMNSFFASVEQEVKPQLRGRPVGVCPFIDNRTCVIAASIEAKRYGVRTGTKVSEARRLCPDIILISDDPSIYRTYHHRIMKELDQTRCKVIIKSIDEAFLELPHDSYGKAREIGLEVKQRIRQVGSQLSSSIGISSNMFLAKMGTNIRKPDGLIEICPDELEGFYAMLGLTDLHGISWRLARRLQAIGISTALEFYQAPHNLLKRTFGMPGEAWYLRLRGYEVDQKPTHRRQIGHQTTIVPEPAQNLAEVLSFASQLTYKAASRLRAAHMAARSIFVYVRFVDHSGWGQIYRGRYPFVDSASFYHHVERLMTPLRRLPKPVRLVSVTATDLCPIEAVPQSLWSEERRDENLSAAIDDIGLSYGRETIRPASQLLVPQMYDRIGFGNAAHTAKELIQEAKRLSPNEKAAP